MADFVIVLFIAITLTVMVIGLMAHRARVRDEAAERFLASIEAKVGRVVDEHLETLVRKRRRMVRTDDYGVENATDWQKEIQHFLDKVALKALDPQEVQEIFFGPRTRFIQFVEARVQAGMATIPAPKGLPPGLSPLDFEGLCAETLRERGWQASTTQASGDQGADVIAVKDGMRLVLQCKLYSGTVGNKAVQEVAAAMAHYGADHGAVVATNGFTKSAATLAASTGVHLLHFDDLVDFADGL